MVRTRRAAMAMLASSAMSVAACGSTDPEPAAVLVSDPPRNVVSTVEPAFTESAGSAPLVVVVSDDGSLAIEAAAADVERIDPRLRIVEPSDWPDELVGDDGSQRIAIHQVEPAAAVFDEPVTVTRRIDVSTLDDALAPSRVPVVVLMTRSDAGAYSLLDDQRVTRAGSALFASATTTYAGAIVTVDTGAAVDFDGATSSDDSGGFATAPSLAAFVDVRARLSDDAADRIDWDEFDPDLLAGLPKIDDPTTPFTAHLVSDADPEATPADAALTPVVQRTVARSDGDISMQLVEVSTVVDDVAWNGPLLGDGATSAMGARVAMLLTSGSG